MAKTRIPKNPTVEEMAALVRHKDANIRCAIAERPDFKPTEVQVAVGLKDPAINVVYAFLRKAVYEEGGVGLSPEQIEEGMSSKHFGVRQAFTSCGQEGRVVWENRLLRKTFMPLAEAMAKPNVHAL